MTTFGGVATLMIGVGNEVGGRKEERALRFAARVAPPKSRGRPCKMDQRGRAGRVSQYQLNYDCRLTLRWRGKEHRGLWGGTASYHLRERKEAGRETMVGEKEKPEKLLSKSRKTRELPKGSAPAQKAPFIEYVSLCIVRGDRHENYSKFRVLLRGWKEIVQGNTAKKEPQFGGSPKLD